MRIQKEHLDWYGIDLPFRDLAEPIDDGYIGTGDTLNTQQEWKELVEIVRIEGLVLDPVCTLESFLGMADHCRQVKIGKG